MTGHLGDRVSALVDGQLAPAAAERALAHVACCPRCASDLAAARAARRVLSDVDDVRPAGDLTARLLALGGAAGPDGAPGAPAARAARPMDPFVPPSGARGASAAFGDGRALLGQQPGVLGSRGLLGGSVLGGGVLGGRGFIGTREPFGAHGRRGLRAAVGSLTGLGMVAVGLFLLGDRPPVAPATESSEALSLLGDAGASAVPVSVGAEPAAGASTEEYLDWMRAEGWTCPAEVPDDWSVTSVRLRDGGATLEVDLSGPSGDVVVTEQHGRLDAAALTAADRLDVDGRTVYLLSSAPWHAAWQSGDTVIEIVSADAGPDVATVVSQFPDGEFDSGLPARLTRGWDTFTAAMHLP
ncbi:zf-HC2 domain-containing protein [Cellulomonas endometrii]|uniref:zf-HC2 domain-containing protein n=1 Tax=Cellulomonas endometrii TaxID=3036301 RepID=UPI0024AD8584|nr:zf-HC2 domain-containing protein [Cellulomonas endometrii]